MFAFLKDMLFGAPLNPLNPLTRKHTALIALFAWVGLGADALSSSCYGPEQAYLALGANSHLALYVAVITVITVFIIAFGYNQVIELFPNGGGGYQVASKLLHPYIGLVAGSALIVDYVLTIAVSIAGGADALFSFLPTWMAEYKLWVDAVAIVTLLVLNMRGMKETILVLLPIFIGFFVTHVALILYGIIAHSQGLLTVLPITTKETLGLAQSVGWLGVIGLVLHAYSLGAGTYTGLEAVSNNVQHLVEPRVSTGRRTMLYMAISLSLIAGGLIMLYLLWGAQPQLGRTLNATVFHSILGDSWLGQSTLVLVLELEAGLLFIAANSGFAAGPSVLANMAVDHWVPNLFRHLSSRLVVQNGLIIFSVFAMGILLWTKGDLTVLVVLYSINVFITFSLSLLGICVYWARQPNSVTKWRHLLFAGLACSVTTTILAVTLFYKFKAGGWLTLLLTTILIGICLMIRRHYQRIAKTLKSLDAIMEMPIEVVGSSPHAINPELQTAVIYLNTLSVGMHTFLSVLRLFPGQFKNFVFLTAGQVDAESFSGQTEFETMQAEVNKTLDYFVRYCNQYEYPAEGYAAFGTDPTEELIRLSDMVIAKYPHCIFFASKLIFARDNLLSRLLHNQTPNILQQDLHFKGQELVILPMKI